MDASNTPFNPFASSVGPEVGPAPAPDAPDSPLLRNLLRSLSETHGPEATRKGLGKALAFVAMNLSSLLEYNRRMKVIMVTQSSLGLKNGPTTASQKMSALVLEMAAGGLDDRQIISTIAAAYSATIAEINHRLGAEQRKLAFGPDGSTIIIASVEPEEQPDADED